MGYVELKYRDDVVWSAKDWDRRIDPESPYITFVHDVER